ncbi:hypothetical protein LINGRAHAP2_LOCUS15687 [Linum grandiflorum]
MTTSFCTAQYLIGIPINDSTVIIDLCPPGSSSSSQTVTGGHYTITTKKNSCPMETMQKVRAACLDDHDDDHHIHKIDSVSVKNWCCPVLDRLQIGSLRDCLCNTIELKSAGMGSSNTYNIHLARNILRTCAGGVHNKIVASLIEDFTCSVSAAAGHANP